MALYHCSKCHHEWEGINESTTCDWCEQETIGYVIASETGLESLVKKLTRQSNNRIETLKLKERK